jgi:hypothetical protein
MWQERVVSQTKETVRYKRFIDFVQDYPPDGLHTKMDVLMKICQSHEDMEAVDLLARVSAGKPGGNNNPGGNNQHKLVNVDNINIDQEAKDRPTGTSAAATMRRLAKDFPAIHEKVLEKRLSPNAAAREAGFRQPKFQMPTDATAAGRYLAQRVDADWMLACYDAFMKSLDRE